MVIAVRSSPFGDSQNKNTENTENTKTPVAPIGDLYTIENDTIYINKDAVEENTEGKTIGPFEYKGSNVSIDVRKLNNTFEILSVSRIKTRFTFSPNPVQCTNECSMIITPLLGDDIVVIINKKKYESKEKENISRASRQINVYKDRQFEKILVPAKTGGKRNTRRQRKSKKSRKGKSRKYKRRSNRRRR